MRRVARTVAAASFVVLPAGLLPMLSLGDVTAAVLGWSILVGASVAACARPAVGDRTEEGVSTRRGLTVWCTILAVFGLVTVPIAASGWIIAGVLVAVAWWTGRPVGRRAHRVAWTPLVVATPVAAAMVALRPEILVVGDGPAHVGAVRDAITGGSWMPTVDGVVDPRFGVLHGLYAAVSTWTGADPAAVFATASALFVPLALLGFAAWMRAWGVPAPASWLLSAFFVVAGAGGRGFSLWRAAFPGDALVGIVAFALAGLFVARGRGGRDFEHGIPWCSSALLATSASLHPFAWWLATSAIGLGGVFSLASGRHRGVSGRLLATAALSGVVGAAILIPRLLVARAESNGLHEIPTDVLLLGDGASFVADPLALVHAAGLAALSVGPLLLLAPGPFWRRPWAPLAAAIATIGWILAFVPPITTAAWSAVSYLVLRSFRLIVTPWWWWALVSAIAAGWFHATPWSRVRRVLCLVAVGGLVVIELGVAARVISEGPPREAPAVRARIEAMVDALDRWATGPVVAAPRTSYALRAHVGGAWPLTPVAHCSPTDVGLVDRLAAFGELRAATTDSAAWHGALDVLGPRWILVDRDPASLALGPEFGWVPSAESAARLERRLVAIGLTPADQGDDWSLWRVPDDAWAREAATVAEVRSRPDPGTAAIARGSRFDVVEAHVLGGSAAAGGTVDVELWLRAIDGPPRTVHPGWESVYLRWRAPGPEAPASLAAVDKLYRKLVVERSARSAGRFGRAHFPFDGTWNPERWPAGELVRDQATIRIPRHVAEGSYAVEITVQEAPWRARRHLDDVLRDEDRYSGAVVDTVTIVRSR